MNSDTGKHTLESETPEPVTYHNQSVGTDSCAVKTAYQQTDEQVPEQKSEELSDIHIEHDSRAPTL